MVRGHSKDGIRECILKDGTKTYEARVKRTGEAQISQRFPSRREALAWKRAVDSQIDRGIPPLNSKTVLIRTIIEDYLRHRKSSSNPLPANQITEYERVKLDLGNRAIGGLDEATYTTGCTCFGRKVVANTRTVEKSHHTPLHLFVSSTTASRSQLTGTPQSTDIT